MLARSGCGLSGHPSHKVALIIKAKVTFLGPVRFFFWFFFFWPAWRRVGLSVAAALASTRQTLTVRI